MNIYLIIGIAIFLFLLSAALVRMFCAYAIRQNLLDTPNARSSHEIPTPRGGGIVFVFLWFLIMGLGVIFYELLLEPVLMFLLGPLMVSCIGYCDDRRSLSPRVRFGVQVLAAVVCMTQLSLFVLQNIELLESNTLYLLSNSTIYLNGLVILLAGIALVWSANLFNFMDGLDGLAAVEALMVLGCGGALYLLFDFVDIALFIWSLCIGVAGFLVWNWPKARVFMGDSGSYCLGFAIALFAIFGEIACGIPIVLWIILYGVFWFDATITLLRRLYRGDRITLGHREHAYQRLHRAGVSQTKVLCCVIILNSVLIGIVLSIIIQPQWIIMGFCMAIGILTVAYLWVEKLYPMKKTYECEGGKIVS